jgi:hypothetical protein
MATSCETATCETGAAPADGSARVTSGIACTMRCVRDGAVESAEGDTECPACCAPALEARHANRTE